ncbi:MAG TPA: PA14 domain-containing protein, partial [Verrucomicrobiae bacterium]
MLFLAAVATQAAIYKESGGRVLIEAEHFDVRTANADTHIWQIMPDENGAPFTAADAGFVNARGGKYMQSQPDILGGNVANYNTVAQVGQDPHLDFKVQISNAGQYRLYLRFGGYDGSSDSIYAQILEVMTTAGGTGPDWYRYVGQNAGDFDSQPWNGSGAPSTDTANRVGGGGGEIPAVWNLTAGTYTIRLGMREDGSAVDAICLQFASLPAPDNPGPAESLTTTQADTTAPTLVSASTAGNPNGVLLTFDEAISAATAANKANFTINNGVTVNSSQLWGNNFTVLLSTTAIAPGKQYEVTVNGVQDTSGNTIVANTKATFLQVDGSIQRRTFPDSAGTLAGLTNSPAFLQDKPDEVTYPTLFEGPVNYRNNYGTDFRGYITAPVSGDYVFFICSDDFSTLFLSTDENPANKKMIAFESAWSDSRRWVSSAGGSDLTAKRSDQNAATEWPTGNTITLVANQRYYIEAIHAEGGGGDNIAVTWMKPGDPEPADGDAPIPGAYLSAFGITPGPVTIVTPPANTTSYEPVAATFSVTAGGTPPYSYQWY